jgi:rod shape-determining protein MreD
MPIITFFMLGIMLLILQTSLLISLPEWLGRPDPLFVLIVFAATRLELTHGAIVLLLLGLLMDIFSGIFLGLYPIVYLLLFWLLRSLSQRLVIYEVAHLIPLVLSCYLCINGLIFVIATMLVPENDLVWNWKKILLQMLLLAIISLPLFSIFNFVEQLSVPKKAHTFLRRSSSKSRNAFRD